MIFHFQSPNVSVVLIGSISRTQIMTRQQGFNVSSSHVDNFFHDVKMYLSVVSAEVLQICFFM